ncbi:pyridoxamine 5'-phosphate oxidase family protein [Pollutimonas harenae]|uniref:Pyridoxamine 5'-phosphate oxidase family protein n=1 Tax=Pollutimonas harenae TaxID=657015 RepID=A0A853H6Q9_9BURK|nr:pyridoxamine 5'-phosphate oxidase family protein [Pollutimonas harenae]NYT86835.1 pyridoxamine 5'-phosphate oxidase family protein [Pollutimonas harenae]TEA71478.1 pyridoxamine 5'-phosphate oxidase family protein [Pollutimonas harenae]
MSELDTPHRITDLQALEALYGSPASASLKKEVDYIHRYYRKLVEASPFVVLATNGPDGLDASPRGDPTGFVRVCDEETLLLADRRGNNRIDSLRNIIHDPRVALLFLIPGVGETLRINGEATISTDPTLLEQFSLQGKLPSTVLIIKAKKVFFQCSRAILRSRLWDPALHVERASLPSTGTILETLSNAEIDGNKYDADLPERVQKTMY